MKYAIAEVTRAVILGRQGENEVTTIKFPIAEWIAEFDVLGTFALLNVRPGEADELAYPCVITTSNEFVYWVVKQADLVNKGIGRCELIYTVGTQVGKSAVFSTNVLESIESGSETPPEPYQDWVDEVLEASSKIKAVVNISEAAYTGQEYYSMYANGTPLKYYSDTIVGAEFDTGTLIASFYYYNADDPVTGKGIYKLSINNNKEVLGYPTLVGTFHTHNNQTTLDKFGESNGKPTYNGEVITHTNLSEFTNDTGFITKAVDDLTNYYLKSSTYTKTEVDNLIAGLEGISFEIVQTLPVTGEPSIIYLVPTETAGTGNGYDEYIYINNAWELIGSTEANSAAVEVYDATQNRLKYSLSEILEMYDNHTVMTYNKQYVFAFTTVYPRLIQFNYFKRDGVTNRLAWWQAAWTWNSTPSLSFDIRMGTFTDYVFDETYKNKLDGIEAGAQVNTVTDVRDFEGNSLLAGTVAVIPEVPEVGEILEIYDRYESGVNYSNYTGMELYGLVGGSAKLCCYNGNLIIGANILDASAGTYLFYYFYYSGAVPDTETFNIKVRRITVDSNKTITQDYYACTFSEANYRNEEKNKLALIEPLAQVNNINDVVDVEGNSLVSNKIAHIPSTELTTEEMEQVCSVFSDFVQVGNTTVSCNNIILTM